MKFGKLDARRVAGVHLRDAVAGKKFSVGGPVPSIYSDIGVVRTRKTCVHQILVRLCIFQ